MTQPRSVVVVGAGMGGLTAALWLSHRGVSVELIEARPGSGGLASGFTVGGHRFDAGPYILLDRPGLGWVFEQLGLNLESQVSLNPVDPVYEVSCEGDLPVTIRRSAAETAEGLESRWPGCGKRYLEFVAKVELVRRALHPMLFEQRPGLWAAVRSGAWRGLPFLARSLGSVLAASGLPGPVCDSLGIWTHVAGQSLAAAPSPLAFVPALVHAVGAFYPTGGIQTIPDALTRAAVASGVHLRLGARVTSLRVHRGRAAGVRLESGEELQADAVISNAGGVQTHLDWIPGLAAGHRSNLLRLPQQSPGVCAYLEIDGAVPPPYLSFNLPRAPELCRLMIRPQPVPSIERGAGSSWSARLLGPMRHDEATALGPSGQSDYLDCLLAEDWWRPPGATVRVLARRTPRDWGREFSLHADAMNPVMTSRFMWAGRIPHRSPHLSGLYLAGSSTHPGQWVSFAGISGIHAARALLEDLGSC